MARVPVMAAGGIVLRREKPPRIAVVRLRKRNEWVLPKGKLDFGETPRDAAEREVLEETGHDVTLHEFLGTLVYESRGRSKVVHYWRMEADGEQVYELMGDVRAVDWLPLSDAVQRLSRGHERAFLETVGPVALQAAVLAEKARRSRSRQGAPEKRRARRSVAPRPATTPAFGEPATTSLQPELVPSEEGAHALLPAEVAIDAPVYNDEQGIAVFAPRVEPASGAAQAAPIAGSGNLVQRVRDWLRRMA